jgi:hypothetical protein
MFTEGGTVIVPGRGRLCDEFDVVEYVQRSSNGGLPATSP